VKRYVGNGMVLQGKPYFENGVMPRRWVIAKCLHQFRKRHRIREGIHGRLMHRAQALGKRTIRFDLASKRDYTGAVAHCFPRCLSRPIRNGRADQDIILTCPAGERDLKRGQQRAKECRSSAAGQFAGGLA
jgi:hypothetical protein